MKLIYCITCEDLVKLQPHKRYCQCASSSGRYLDNDTNEVEVSGPCRVLGIQQGTTRAMVDLAATDPKAGGIISLFILPEIAKTVKRV